MRLKPVKHPRVWLAVSLASCAVGVGIVLWDDFFFDPSSDVAPRLVRIWGIAIPLSLVFCWTLSVWRRAYDRARRIERGHCPCCDYDLRATLDRCPECGTAVALIAADATANAAPHAREGR